MGKHWLWPLTLLFDVANAAARFLPICCTWDRNVPAEIANTRQIKLALHQPGLRSKVTGQTWFLGQPFISGKHFFPVSEFFSQLQQHRCSAPVTDHRLWSPGSRGCRALIQEVDEPPSEPNPAEHHDLILRLWHRGEPAPPAGRPDKRPGTSRKVPDYIILGW